MNSVRSLPLFRVRCVSYCKQASDTVLNGNTGVTQDIYGPPDAKSSLRLVTFYIPPDETAQEKQYRLERAKVQDWNQEFWTSHNTQFILAKERFISSVLEKKANVSTVSQPLTADDLSEFYRSFLDENREKHLQYNIEWHKKNICLVVPGVKAFVSRLLKRLS